MVTWRREFVWSVADPRPGLVRNTVRIRRAPLEPMPDDMLLAGLATGDSQLALAFENGETKNGTVQCVSASCSGLVCRPGR
jgi:hypothetical protein